MKTIHATIDGIEYVCTPVEKEADKVLAGYHPVTGKEFYCATKDLPKLMTYNDTVKYIEENCPGWRFPTLAELQVMYHNRDRIGGFKDKYYWSCTEHRTHPSNVYNVCFTDGDDGWDSKDDCALSVRPVHAELPA